MTTASIQRTRTVFRIACVLFGAALSYGADPQSARSCAPSFVARDINNRLVSLDSLTVKGPVIIDFWATWCVPCMLEFKALKKLHKKYEDKQLTIVAISQDNPSEIAKVKQMVAANKWPFIVVIDAGKKISAKYQVRSVPALFIVRTDGKICYSSRSFVSGDEVKLEEAIRGLPDAP
ncbi:MAG: TlpA family protein disulfide reductase [Chitinispirillaceae bacterium]|nr:TlpA family protein disulfide reductase [Chitinispirillaceae bacterium]